MKHVPFSLLSSAMLLSFAPTLINVGCAAPAAAPATAPLRLAQNTETRVPDPTGTTPVAGLERKAPANIVWPDDAGVINVKTRYGAKGDGTTDDTLAIQKAFNDYPGVGSIYLPNGTYLISDTIRWAGGQKRNILEGQSTAGTILKLKDNADGFANPDNPKTMIYTGKAPAQRFRNGIRTLTIDSGKGNAGAIGAQFIANNQGGIRDVTIRSGDGAGVIGLDLGYTGEQGPCLIRNLRVEGFDVGISNKSIVDSTTFEFIELENQNEVAVDNDGQIITMRGVLSRNKVPFLNNRGPAIAVLTDSVLVGEGDAKNSAAIANEAGLYVRNVQTRGYKTAIENQAGTRLSNAGPDIGEWTSHPVLSEFPSPPRGLGLPIKEVPNVPWDDPKTWANVKNFGPPEILELVRQEDGKKWAVEDWSGAMQRAIDSGATTVYFPNDAGNVAPKNAASAGADAGGKKAQAKPAVPKNATEKKPATQQPAAKPDNGAATTPYLNKKQRRELEKAKEAAPQKAARARGFRLIADGDDTPEDEEMKAPPVVRGGDAKIRDSGLYRPIRVRGNVRRIIGCESEIGRLVNNTEQTTAYQEEYRPVFIVEDGAAPTVVIERFDTWYSSIRFEQKSKRNLVISSLSFYDVETQPGSGDVFLEDVRCKTLEVNGSNLWGRQVNPEGHEEQRILNNGGNVWILGLKTENDPTIARTVNGGKTEIVGGFYYANKNNLPVKQWFVNEDSSHSFIGGEWVTKRGRPFDSLAIETRDGVTRKLEGKEAFGRGAGHMVTLYTGYKGSGTATLTAPQNFTATAKGTGQVDLKWNPVAGADGYRIEVSQGGESRLVNTVAGDVAAYSVAVALKADTNYNFKLLAFNGKNQSSANATAKTLSPPPPGTGVGLSAQYFKGRDLTNPVRSGNTGAATLPVSEAGEVQSLRWTGQIEPLFSDNYQFSSDANGTRLWVDGEQVFDVWDFGRTPARGTVMLEAGRKYDVKFEQRMQAPSKIGGRSIEKSENPIGLFWQNLNQERQIVPATQLYPAAKPQPEISLSATETKTKEGGAPVKVTLARVGDASAALKLKLNVSGNATPGTDYQKLPEELALGAGEKSASFNLTTTNDNAPEPNETVVLSLDPSANYNLVGAPVTILINDDDLPPAGAGTGLKGAYFVDDKFTTLKTTRVDNDIEFGWDKKAPMPGLDPKAGYSIRWTGQVQPLFSEEYQFTLKATKYGGARLSIDGKVLIDTFPKNSTDSAKITLQAGKKYDIQLDYVNQRFYGSGVTLSWQSASQFEQAVPKAQLFPG